MIIVIAAAVPGVPPGKLLATCQECGDSHWVQDGTAATIKELGGAVTIWCLPCLRRMQPEVLRAATITGVREGRRMIGLSDL
jgi:hypothetical protein